MKRNLFVGLCLLATLPAFGQMSWEEKLSKKYEVELKPTKQVEAPAPSVAQRLQALPARIVQLEATIANLEAASPVDLPTLNKHKSVLAALKREEQELKTKTNQK